MFFTTKRTMLFIAIVAFKSV